METIKIGKWGSFSLAYLKKVTKAKFWKDFCHLTEEQRNEVWEATHERKRLPKQVEDVQPTDGGEHVNES